MDIIHPKGNHISIKKFVDVYHAHYIKTRRYFMGEIIIQKTTKIQWYNRRHNYLDTSTYVAELVETIVYNDFPQKSPTSL